MQYRFSEAFGSSIWDDSSPWVWFTWEREMSGFRKAKSCYDTPLDRMAEIGSICFFCFFFSVFFFLFFFFFFFFVLQYDLGVRL